MNIMRDHPGFGLLQGALSVTKETRPGNFLGNPWFQASHNQNCDKCEVTSSSASQFMMCSTHSEPGILYFCLFFQKWSSGSFREFSYWKLRALCLVTSIESLHTNRLKVPWRKFEYMAKSRWRRLTCIYLPLSSVKSPGPRLLHNGAYVTILIDFFPKLLMEMISTKIIDFRDRNIFF